jgi:hypothetical protein
MVKKINFSDALAKAAADERNHSFVSTTTSGPVSFGVVNNINGKRLTLSKALAAALGLEDAMEILPSHDENFLFVGKKLPVDKAFPGKLSGADKKICYSAELVERVTTAFNLDFSDKTSMSVNTIEFTEIDGNPVAVVHFPKAGEDAAPSGGGTE